MRALAISLGLVLCAGVSWAKHGHDEVGVLTVECQAPSFERLGGKVDFVFYRHKREMGRAWVECWDNQVKEVPVLLDELPDVIEMRTKLYIGAKGEEDIVTCKGRTKVREPDVRGPYNGVLEKSRLECWAPTGQFEFGNDCVRATYEHVESVSVD